MSESSVGKLLRAMADRLFDPILKLPHRADMKAGDEREPCHYEYAGHEGPCVPTLNRHLHDPIERGA